AVIYYNRGEHHIAWTHINRAKEIGVEVKQDLHRTIAAAAGENSNQ
ncbi:MAG: hypothetical protein IIA65_05460, partial [Planctomycetes bacterium]|nr:hypothetical protein [Planctomycetota bacterium]